MASTTLKTPFGEFRGRTGDGTVRYLGIPYARLRDQLSPPEMIRQYDGVVDATSYGPRAPAPEASLFEQQHLIQHVIDDSPSPGMYGTECLNLNIAIPTGKRVSQKNEKGFPVMVWIHGGGFIMGSNALPHWDPSRFVAFSSELRIPVVVVSINYRLGILGNLTSEELRENGYPGNNALRDQRCALLWVKHHISAFGGDPLNITVFGVSAGSVSVLTHLYGEEPLFKRAICMSGTPLMLKPLPTEEAETSYESVITALGLEKASVSERIQRLTTLSPEELIAATPITAKLTPFLDGELIPGDTVITSANLTSDSWDVPGTKWCEALMIGNCSHDGNVFTFMGLSSTSLASRLYASFSATIGSATASAILSSYGILPTTRDTEAMKAAIMLGTDIAYTSPTLALTRAWPGSAKKYVYHFASPNPWNGPFKGLSTHYLDAVFLFQNFNDRISPEAVKVAEEMARSYISFVNGREPWEEFDGREERVKVFDSNGEVGNRDTDNMFGLQHEGVVDLDELSAAWDSFLAGR